VVRFCSPFLVLLICNVGFNAFTRTFLCFLYA
jgi:hypothetical protein